MNANLRVLEVTALLAVCFGAQTGHANPVGPLTTFTAGTPAMASEVNGNFSAVKTAVDDNANRIGTLETTVTPAGNIVLVPSTATAGNILKGTAPFIHNFGQGNGNTFIGVNAGNFTLTGYENTGSGNGALQALTIGNTNTAIGASALYNNTSGVSNTASGTQALLNNTTGSNNTASGKSALLNNTTGDYNTASGWNALQLNTTGIDNTASGASALRNNTTGAGNTASGFGALWGNTTGSNNTASGIQALQANSTGGANTAIGASALEHNTTGGANTASGTQALQNNTNGFQNTASGFGALQGNTTGSANTASGIQALLDNTTGGANTAIGASALLSNTTGVQNIAIGFNAGSSLTTGSNNIAIGNLGIAAEGNTIRIGDANQTRTFISGIRGVTTGSVTAIPVLIDPNGQLGTVSSSRRVKDDIADMGEASSLLLKLRPVTFHYKSDKSPKGRTLQYGLVAEEVAKVAPGLVAHSADGKIETVYYQHLTPMLLNEYQRQQRTIGAQAAELAKQTAKLEKQAMEIAELRQQAARIAELEKQAARMTAVLRRLEQRGMIATAGR
jgi:hypothetical protein